MWHRMDRMLFARISGAWLGVLRIGFGIIMLYEALWFLGLLPGSSDGPNQVHALFVGDHVRWTFPYRDFPWAQPLPEPFTTFVFVALGIAAALVIAGIGYRIAAATVFVTFAFANLMDASIYLNHFYLECVVALLLVFVPADRRFAVRPRRGVGPLTSDVPSWTLVLFRAQVFLVYFYAGVAKVNRDWLAGEPLRRWLPHPTTASTLDGLLGPSVMDGIRRWLAQDSTVLAISYGGLLFDLVIGVFLLWRRTRLAAFVVAVLFHATNSLLFDIGAFPFLAILLTTVFLEPDWPERLRRAPAQRKRSAEWSAGGTVIERHRAAYVVPLLASWLVLQIALPLRHFVIPGEVSWTEEGHRFSWHMKLRDKYPGRFLIEIVAPQARASASTQYRNVDATRVPWEELPELVVTYEPILGERVIFNPLSRATWSEAVAAARHRWNSTCAEPLQLHKTRSLASILADLGSQLDEAAGRRDAGAAAARRALDEVLALHAALLQGGPAMDLMHLQFRFQDALRRLVNHRPWRKPLLAALWQTPPFACQGAAALDAPFMVVANRCVLLPDNHACCRIDRAECPQLGDTLVDLHQLTAASLRSLPESISFADYQGRPARFWNCSHELHPAQIESLQVSPLLQHTYAQHVADRWQKQFGRRPRVYVTSYVKLNQHTMQPMVDREVDIARVPRQRVGHHTWILPLQRFDGQRRVE